MKTKSTSQTPRTLTRNAIPLAITALAHSAAPGSRAAGDCLCFGYWDTSTGDWFNPLNWGPSHNAVPDCGISCGHPWGVDINRGTAQISTPTQTASACEMFIGHNLGDSGSLSVNHGTLNQCGDIFVGYQGTGKLTITNGGVVSTSFNPSIASQTGSNGSVTVDGQNQDGTKSQWTVTGELDVAGTINSAGGTGLLSVTNSATLTAASVHVYPSGTLTGNSKVTTTTTSGTKIEGTIAPSGNLTIGGNLIFSGTAAAMQSNVVPASANNVSVTSGAATLTGRLTVTMTGTFTPGTTYTLLSADNGRSGNFSSISINYPTCQCFTPVIQYDTNHVKLYLQPAACCQ
jgi:fibronectin-binding autotransporter adhesin